MNVEINKSEGPKTYDIPVFAQTMTVMDILDYIYHNLDHSLAYFRHSSCKQAICGRCTVMLDNTPVLACAKQVDPLSTHIKISPLKGKKVVHDLVVQI